MAVIAIVDPRLLDSLDGALGAHTVLRAVGLADGELREALAHADVLVTAMAPVTAEMIAMAPRLRMVAKPGAGVDNIDVLEATRRGVLVCNAPATRGQAVAEYVLFAALYLIRRAWRPPSDWTELMPDLAGKSLGLVGLGDIGTRVAAAGVALGMDVWANTPSGRNPNPAVPVRFTGLDDLLGLADVLVLCMPLNGNTRGLIDESRLRQMRHDAVLINVARGACVVTGDLERVLQSGHLRGAALDVTDPEPLPDEHALRHLENVLVTSHIAGRSERAQRVAVRVLVDNVVGLLDGNGPRYVVNPEALR